ncbi:TetR/AcrR family transcriptional regulator [Novosphingobium mangrovi (ex Huang et al. 2023)]|uniref:TetR/AcrR family transcriptional regulator n=1 Tax=Novosphingobium mangrovi (ex Huang et al. 2023) TaxID=2976432 RepID=A0ABT2I9Q5_9SPHN|nr:TetR/AcrR family transcriptional regulator [Novosphingobium mangrovi (ex Huang et al. 2023)]MCT2401559.1 TetR/AcrR family transcriptional regulator [Novosphingobium mangrovi (ex Huang et al. 2023)]
MEAREPTRLFSGKPTQKPRPDGRRRGRPTREMIEQRNEELLDRSLDLFLDHGFDATTIDTICADVGMSRRTIYSRYGDKETLFKAALQRAIDQWIIPVERLRDQECEDLEATLVAVARLWVSNIKKKSGMRLVRIANTEVFRSPEVAQYLWERTAEPTLGYLTDLLARRLRPDADSVPDARDAAASFLILVVEGSVQLALWGQMSPDDFDRQIAYRTRLFLKGALCPPAGAAR